MKKDEVAIIVNSAFSLLELIIRLRNQSPDDFVDQEQRLQKLAELTKEFEDKPKDYLQTWEPSDE